MIKLSNAQLWVHDQDEALAFYTQKLGWEVRADDGRPDLRTRPCRRRTSTRVAPLV